MWAYYNEIKPEAAHMLRQLIKDKIIAEGEVDERSITEIKPEEIKHFTQRHFFAGIGGWSVALKLSGWPDDRAVDTGSCPCQPFSNAGNQKGKDDARHLWPAWYSIIEKCRPSRIYGEQVASAIAHGWLDGVYDDLEKEGYAVGSAILPACSIGSPHQRGRLWFVADSDSERYKKPKGRKEKREENGGGFFERDMQWIECPDKKRRPIKPGVCLLANGVQHRAPIIHAYGNAIVPQVAAEFIKATM